MCAYSQFTVTPNNNAASLAQSLVGSGISVSNATLNCGSGAIGTFTYTGFNIAISRGVILSTGLSVDISNPGTYYCSRSCGNNYNDPDLMSLQTNATIDVCILQFDFIPSYNNRSVNLQFGSEEYPNFVSSPFNDVFGVFLTGLNPLGGNYTSKNIAILPDSLGTYILINTVNAIFNSIYFHDNYTSPNNDVAFDGYTELITSVTPVSVGTTYHLKIAIADAVDTSYDSGVLLKDSMFSCQALPVVTFTSLGFPDTVCNSSGTYTLTGGSPSGGTYIGSGVTGNIFNSSTAGIGTHLIGYIYTDNFGCSNVTIDSVTVQSCSSSINYFKGNDRIKIYPNPCLDFINIECADKALLEIYSVMGEKVISEKIEQPSSNFLINTLLSGIYLIKIITNKGDHYQIKFIKE